MTDYTIEELEQALSLPKPSIDDFYFNGAYDEGAYHETSGIWEARQFHVRAHLKTLKELVTLRAENAALQKRVDDALAIEDAVSQQPITTLSKYDLGVLDGYADARRDFRRALEGKLDNE